MLTIKFVESSFEWSLMARRPRRGEKAKEFNLADRTKASRFVLQCWKYGREIDARSSRSKFVGTHFISSNESISAESMNFMEIKSRTISTKVNFILATKLFQENFFHRRTFLYREKSTIFLFVGKKTRGATRFFFSLDSSRFLFSERKFVSIEIQQNFFFFFLGFSPIGKVLTIGATFFLGISSFERGKVFSLKENLPKETSSKIFPRNFTFRFVSTVNFPNRKFEEFCSRKSDRSDSRFR